MIFDALLLNGICELVKKSISDWENRAADKNGCIGLLLVGLKAPKPGLEEFGMFTGAELPKRPAEDAKPTEMEFETVGESASSSRSRAPVKFSESSRFSSSNAFPEKQLNI